MQRITPSVTALPRQFPQGESLCAAVSDGGRSCVYKITFLISRETLPSASWRNSTSESEERISVGIFTSMPLVEIKICEGKYHQIKRMFAAAGNGVIGLKRTQMGGLMLDPNLKEGEIRLLTVQEVQIIENG